MNRELKYLIVEDSQKVCEGIVERMENFTHWHPCNFAHHVDDAKKTVEAERPNLIFIDWALKGGSAYEVLQHIQNIAGYCPYIIFNTGYQSDNPEIPQEIVNNYKIDKYLVKPFWEKLRLYLHDYLEEAEKKQQLKDCLVFITDAEKIKRQINLSNLICICKESSDFSKKTLFFGKQNSITVKATWKQITRLLDDKKIRYFVTNKKEHLVVQKFIEKYQRPFVILKNFPLKIEIVKDKLREFEEWIEWQ